MSASSQTDDDIIVTFKASGITAIWSDECESLLDFAEEQGLTPDFSCRAGICSSCHCELVEGEIEYIDEPLAEPDEGYALICISKPRTSVVIDI